MLPTPGATIFPEKVAVLIDGGFLLKRLKKVEPETDRKDPDAVAELIIQLVNNHLKYINQLWELPNARSPLYRAFYYDARPFTGKLARPTDKNRQIDYSRTPESIFRLELFKRLRKAPAFAVRLGEVRRIKRSWTLRPEAVADLIAGRRRPDSLTDEDFETNFHQKGVDMRLGVDIASITLKKQASKIVLVTGDADFVPAAKLARREGVQIILDPLWQNVSDDLQEHIDGVRGGLRRPE